MTNEAGKPNSAGEDRGRSGGCWPQQRTSVLDWLIKGTRQERFFDAIFAEFCRKLRADGIPIARSVMHLRLLHPQWFGTRVCGGLT
jgi:adenylate cyclase